MAYSADNMALVTRSEKGNIICSPESDEDTSRPIIYLHNVRSSGNLTGRSSDQSIRGNTSPHTAAKETISDVIQDHPNVPAQEANEIWLSSIKYLFENSCSFHCLLAIIQMVKVDHPRLMELCRSYPIIQGRDNPYKIFADVAECLDKGDLELANYKFVSDQERYVKADWPRKYKKQVVNQITYNSFGKEVGARNPLNEIPVEILCTKCGIKEKRLYELELKRETTGQQVTVQQALDNWLQSFRSKCEQCENLREVSIWPADVPVILPFSLVPLEIDKVEDLDKHLKISGKYLKFGGVVFHQQEKQHFTAMATCGDERIYYDTNFVDKANPGSGQITRFKYPLGAEMITAYYFLL